MMVNGSSAEEPRDDGAPASDRAPARSVSSLPEPRPLPWVASMAQFQAYPLWRQLLASTAAGILALCPLLFVLGFGPVFFAVVVRYLIPAAIVVGFPVLWVGRKRRVKRLGHTGLTLLGALLVAVALSLLPDTHDSSGQAAAFIMGIVILIVALIASLLVRVLIRHPAFYCGVVGCTVFAAAVLALLG